MLENVVTGLASGLFVSIFVLAFSRFWRAVIIPWFEERVYKDVHIEGKWFSLYPNGDLFLRQETISIKRHGHFVKGKIVCTHGPDEGEEYTVTGSFRNLILPLIYENTDKTNTDRGTITLKSNNSGQMLSGKVALYNGPTDKIHSANVYWFRSKNDIDEAIKELLEHENEIVELNKKEEKITKEKENIEDSSVNKNKAAVEVVMKKK